MAKQHPPEKRTRRRAPSAAVVPPGPQTATSAELPASYGRTRLTLMEVDPYHLHAYWEVTLRDRRAAARQFAAQAASPPWVLRFYDVAGGATAFDIAIDPAAGNWYVDLWAADKAYYAEIGPRTAQGRFVPVCRSNVAQTPRAGPSLHYAPRWLKVASDLEHAELVLEPAQPARPSAQAQPAACGEAAAASTGGEPAVSGEKPPEWKEFPLAAPPAEVLVPDVPAPTDLLADMGRLDLSSGGLGGGLPEAAAEAEVTAVDPDAAVHV